MKARVLNTMCWSVAYAALAVHTFATNCDWVCIAGELFGWALIIAGLWAGVNIKIKEYER